MSKFASGGGFGGKQYAHTQVSVKGTHDLRTSSPGSQVHPVFDSCGTFFFAQIFQCCHIKERYFFGDQHDQLRLFEFQFGRSAVAFPDIVYGAGEVLRQSKSMVKSPHGSKLERYFFRTCSAFLSCDCHIAECKDTCPVNSVDKFDGTDLCRQKQFVFVVLILRGKGKTEYLEIFCLAFPPAAPLSGVSGDKQIGCPGTGELAFVLEGDGVKPAFIMGQINDLAPSP